MPTFSRKGTKFRRSLSTEGSRRAFAWSVATVRRGWPQVLGSSRTAGPSFAGTLGASAKLTTVLQHLQGPKVYFFKKKGGSVPYFRASSANVVTEVFTSLSVTLPQSRCAREETPTVGRALHPLALPPPLTPGGRRGLQVVVRYGTEEEVVQKKQLNFPDRAQWKQDTEPSKAFISMFLMKNKQNIKYIP